MSTQKIVLKEILGFYKVGAKGLFWNLGYAYIRSMGKDRVFVENTHSFFALPTARRLTAITVGALRYQTAIVPLSSRYRL